MVLIAEHWFGGLTLADDAMLIGPLVQGLQKLVSICENHAWETDLIFSTDKRNPESPRLCA